MMNLKLPFYINRVIIKRALRPFVAIAAISFLSVALLSVVKETRGEGVALSVTVNAGAITFSSDGAQAFSAITPGTPVYATSTLTVATNNTDGYNITLSGDDQGTANTVLDLATDAGVGITDQREWSSSGPGTGSAATGTTPSVSGKAELDSALDNSLDVLAFRVELASTIACFYSSTWWGSDDQSANALWAGVASSTNTTIIGQCGYTGQTAGADDVHISGNQTIKVGYYLDVPATQQTGAYAGGLTYTGTLN